MAQPLSGGFQTWTCGCGRLGLALALAECPECGLARPEDPAASPAGLPPVVVAVPAPAARRRARTRRAAAP